MGPEWGQNGITDKIGEKKSPYLFGVRKKKRKRKEKRRMKERKKERPKASIYISQA